MQELHVYVELDQAQLTRYKNMTEIDPLWFSLKQLRYVQQKHFPGAVVLVLFS